MIFLPIAEPEPTGCQTREELLTRLTLLVYPCTPSRQRAGAPGANWKRSSELIEITGKS